MQTDFRALTLQNIWQATEVADSACDDFRMHSLCRCLAVEGLGDFASTLGGSFEPKLLRAAYPLLAASASTNATLCDTAMATLQRVCGACGYGSLSEMVQCNSDYLVDSICRSLTRGAEPLRRPRARPTLHSSHAPGGRRVKPLPPPAVAARASAGQEAELQLGVDVLHVLLAHVGAEKGALLADSLQAVLALLDLNPAPQASAALASTLAAFVAAVSDAAAYGASLPKDEGAGSHDGPSYCARADAGHVGGLSSDTPPPRSTTGGRERQEERAAGVDDEEEEEESDLDIGELQLAMEYGADGDSRSGTARRPRDFRAARPTATAKITEKSN